MSKEIRESNRPIIAVGVLIFNSDNKILLGERFSNFGKGMNALPGGKVEKNETFVKSAERELFEETGLCDSVISFGKYISIAYENIFGLDGLTVGILARTESEPKEIVGEEIGNWKWYDIENLPENIFPPSKRIIDNYKCKKILFRQNR
ncbi:MAG: NUDIX domain-containing protein [Candidatus Woesebacteria bacterium]|nr:NUDIX domain-containing protein [Candidatus Woesebacteria bacterium]